MDAVSLPLYQLVRSHWLRLIVVPGLLFLLALLAFAAGLAEVSTTGPADGGLVAPFRWQPIGPAEG